MKKLSGEVDQKQMTSWKKSQDVFTIIVDHGNERLVGYLKAPGKNVAIISAMLMAQSEILPAGETILKNCWLGGDERLIKPGNKTEMLAAAKAALLSRNTVVFPDAYAVEIDGDTLEITVVVDGKPKSCRIATVDHAVLAKVLSLHDQQRSIEAGIAIITGGWKSGDDLFRIPKNHAEEMAQCAAAIKSFNALSLPEAEVKKN